MKLWNWLMPSCLSDMGLKETSVISLKSQPKALKGPKTKAATPVQQPKEAPYLANELINHIFKMLAADLLAKQSIEADEFQDLLQIAKVNKQWKAVAEDLFSKIYQKLLNGEDKPEGFSAQQSLCLLYNWKKQKGISTSKPMSKSFDPVDCHQPVDYPAMTYDKVELNGVRILLNSKLLVALDAKAKTKVPPRLWYHKMDNPDQRILVSTDGKLIATQHYYETKDKQKRKRLACRFDVRHLLTGQLLGQVKVLCPGDQKIFNHSNIQFDFKKFVYQKEGKERTRYFDPTFIEAAETTALPDRLI